MPDHAAPVERRTAARRPAAFGFWIVPGRGAAPVAAWMIDISEAGGACLVEPHAAPRVGDRIQLRPMNCVDPDVRRTSPRLPRFARVVRGEARDGITQALGLRFDPARDPVYYADGGARTTRSRAPR